MTQSDEMRVLFIPCYVDGLAYTSASARIRARWPAQYWHEADVYPSLSRPFGAYDVYVFQKAYITSFSRHAIRSLRVQGDKILAFDMCDADWEQSEMHKQRLLSVLPLFDFAVSPTRALQEWLGRWVPAEVIPDRLDLQEFRWSHEHSPGPLSVVWFGYSHNLGELDALWPEIEPLMSAHSMRLTILSDALPERWRDRAWGGWNHRPRFVKWTEEGANAEVAKHDIALVPQRNPYKSNNRAITAWALGVVPVETGAQLEKVLDYDKRRREAELGQALVLHDYDVSISVAQWKDLLAKYLARRAAANTFLASVRKANGVA